VLVLLVVVVALAGVAVPAASFTTADVPRGASVSVTQDTDGIVGLDKATSVQAGEKERLVTVTNNNDQTVDVTITFENPGRGYLTAANTGQRNSVELTLTQGESQDIIACTDGNNAEARFSFSAVVGDGELTGESTTDRKVTIENGGSGQPCYAGNGNGGGNGNGNGNGGGNGNGPPGSDGPPGQN
jgi:hypothetical protein